MQGTTRSRLTAAGLRGVVAGRDGYRVRTLEIEAESLSVFADESGHKVCLAFLQLPL